MVAEWFFHLGDGLFLISQMACMAALITLVGSIILYLVILIDLRAQRRVSAARLVAHGLICWVAAATVLGGAWVYFPAMARQVQPAFLMCDTSQSTGLAAQLRELAEPNAQAGPRLWLRPAELASIDRLAGSYWRSCITPSSLAERHALLAEMTSVADLYQLASARHYLAERGEYHW